VGSTVGEGDDDGPGDVEGDDDGPAVGAGVGGIVGDVLTTLDMVAVVVTGANVASEEEVPL
jgi:hypothetical protein